MTTVHSVNIPKRGDTQENTERYTMKTYLKYDVTSVGLPKRDDT